MHENCISKKIVKLIISKTLTFEDFFVCFGAELIGAFQESAGGHFEEPWCALEVTVKPVPNIG